MLATLKDIVLINAYWVSLPLIGFALLRIIEAIPKSGRFWKNPKSIADFVLRQHFFVVVFFSFALVSVILGVIALLCYIFQAPAIVFTAFYLFLLAVSLGYLLVSLSRNIFNKKDLDIFGLHGQTLFVKLLFILLCVALVGDFLFGLYVKSYVLVSADSYVHLSRIVEILNHGFTIDSGFFSGLPEVGYHFNLVYPLYVIPSQLFRMMPMEVWEYSFGFFRVLLWIGIFTLAWYVYQFWLKGKINVLLGSVLTTILAVAYFGSLFYTGVYPNQVVTLWLILIVISLSLRESGKKEFGPVLLVAAFLTTFTHPTYALMSAAFIGLVFALRLLIEKRSALKDKASLILYGSTIAILMLGPLRTATFPNRITTSGLLVGSFPTLDLGIFSIKQPENPFAAPLMSVLVLALGTTGLIFLLTKLWSGKRQWAIAFALVIFFPLMVYTPIIFDVLHKVLPLWVIDRFTAMNVLNYISVPLGIYCIYILAGRAATHFVRFRPLLSKEGTGYVVVTGLVLILAAYSLPSSLRTVVKSRPENENYYSFMTRTYDALHTIFNNEKVVVASPGDSFLMTAIMPIDVIGIEEGHTTPAADATDRAKCQRQLMRSFNYSDLKAVGASYVVIAKYDKDYHTQRSIVEMKPYLHKVAQSQEFDVYQFNASEAPGLERANPFGACVKYQQVEKR